MLVDVSPILDPVLEKYSDKYRHNRLNPEAWIRLMLFRELEQYRYLTDLNRKLTVEPLIWMKLGFEYKPKYSTICMVMNKRLDEPCKAKLKQLARTAMVEEGKQRDIIIGANVSEDSTPVAVSKNDPDGDINPHYESVGKMVKANILTDVDHKLELETQVYGGTEYDGHHSYRMINAVATTLPTDASWWGDEHYSSAAAWAIIGTNTDYELKFKIKKTFSLTIDKAATELKSEYQCHHKDENFQVTVVYDEMAKWLVEKYEPDYLEGVEQVNASYKFERSSRRLARRISNKKRLLKAAKNAGDSAKVARLEKLIDKLDRRCQALKARAKSNYAAGTKKKNKNDKALIVVGKYLKAKAKSKAALDADQPNLRVLSESKNSELKRKSAVGVIDRGIHRIQGRFDVKLCLKLLIVRQRLLFDYRDKLGSVFRIA